MLFLIVLAAMALPRASTAGDGVVALQTADPACTDRSGNIYVNCGNGTVTDNRTGLVWLRNADCLDYPVIWSFAMDWVAGLSDIPAGSQAAAHDCGLSDGSSPGEWRLPSLSEWEAMVADALACNPVITDNQGTGCWADPVTCTLQGRTCSFSSVLADYYWSSTASLNPVSYPWVMGLSDGVATAVSPSTPRRVWPVRGGQ